MQIETLLDQISEQLEDGRTTLGGKTKVDAEAIRTIIEEIRLQMPEELIQARKIASERKEILVKAQSSAEDIIAKAKNEAALLVEEHEITKKAKLAGAEIMASAKQQGEKIVTDSKDAADAHTEKAMKWASDIRNSASEFVDTIMKESDKILSESIDDFNKALENVHRARAQLKNATQKKQ